MMRALLTFAAAACLSGCISLLPDPPPAATIYTLRAGAVERVAADPKNVVVAVAQPTAPRSVGSADIVWRQGAEIAFMDRAAWDGAAPDLLQDLVVDVMDRRGGLRAVVRTGGGVRADAEVRWDVSAFEIMENGGRLEARIESSAQVVDLRTRTVLATSRFNETAPISERSGRAAAAALERVATAAAIRIADWTATTVQPSAASTSK
jgi:ABC-type uncharacterized transport system auxiliary subunit